MKVTLKGDLRFARWRLFGSIMFRIYESAHEYRIAVATRRYSPLSSRGRSFPSGFGRLVASVMRQFRLIKYEVARYLRDRLA